MQPDQSLVDFFRNSPMVDEDLEFERSQELAVAPDL
jgi:hypothetical protein